MPLWLAYWARNFLWDARGDCLWRRGAFPFLDFSLPRTTHILAVWVPFVRPWAFLPPWHGPWAWYKMGRNPQILWPHNSPSKSCCPAPQTGRRILMFSGLYHGQLSFVPLWALSSLCLPKACSWRFGIMRCTVINTFMGWRGSLRYTECVFNGAFMKRCGYGGWGFPWELGEIYFAWHSLFEVCARWILLDFALYIRRLGRTIFHIY